MIELKIRAMVVRPIASSDLVFSSAGIIESRRDRARLGGVLPRQTLDDLIGSLLETTVESRSADDVQGEFDLKVPKWNSETIHETLAPKSLFVLSNRAQKIALEKAIRQRNRLYMQNGAAIKQKALWLRARHSLDILRSDFTPSAKIQELLEAATAARRAYSTALMAMASVETLDLITEKSVTTTKDLGKNREHTIHVFPSLQLEKETRSYVAGAACLNDRGQETEDGKETGKPNRLDVTRKELLLHSNFPQPTPPTEPVKDKQLERHIKLTTVREAMFAPPRLAFSVPFSKSGVKVSEFSESDAYNFLTDSVTSPTGTLQSITTEPKQNDTESKTNEKLLVPENPALLLTLREARESLEEHRVMIDAAIESAKFVRVKDCWELELEELDYELAQAQLSLAMTYLLPNAAGIITNIYKDEGEFVAYGEPVLRVENQDTVLLAAEVHSRSLLRPGGRIQLSAVPFEGGEQINRDGTIVSVLGHQRDDDEWNIIVELDVRKVGGTVVPIGLPFNYSFDRDTTQLFLKQ